MSQRTVRIGCGSGYERDTIEGAVAVAERGEVQYLCFDTLAERTLVLAQQARQSAPSKGYNPLLGARMRAILPICLGKGTKVIGNFGAANPRAASEKIIEIVRELGYHGVKVATVEGDDVRDIIRGLQLVDMETEGPLEIKGQLISANAYIGADPLVEALEGGADIVVGGRIGDLALFLAPLIYEFKWGASDLDQKAGGSVIAHVLECGPHSTGGNLAFPGYVKVPGLDNLGLPLAEVDENGDGVITKVDGTGGLVSELSLAAQLAYEVFDPANYETPDVVVDVRNVQLKQVGKDRVKVFGARGKEMPDNLKVLVGVHEGYIAESEGGWAGWGSYEKAKLCISEAIEPQLGKFKDKVDETRIDIIGVNAIHGPVSPAPDVPPYEVRLRVAVKTKDLNVAEEIVDVVERATFMGGLGGGGPRRNIRPLLALHPTLIPRDLIQTKVTIEEVR